MRIAALILASLAAAAAPAEPPRSSYVVIVHPETPVSKLDRRFVADAFLRRKTRWPDDKPIRPVDLGPDSPARARFSQETLALSVASVRNYWQQRIFSGRDLPPPELDDDAVVSYVLSHPGALGYVVAGTRLKGAKVVDVN